MVLCSPLCRYLNCVFSYPVVSRSLVDDGKSFCLRTIPLCGMEIISSVYVVRAFLPLKVFVIYLDCFEMNRKLIIREI